MSRFDCTHAKTAGARGRSWFAEVMSPEIMLSTAVCAICVKIKMWDRARRNDIVRWKRAWVPVPLEALPPCYLLLPLPTCQPNNKLTTVWLHMRQDMSDDETRTLGHCEDIYILPEFAPMCWTDGFTFAWNPRTFFQRSVYFFLYIHAKVGVDG